MRTVTNAHAADRNWFIRPDRVPTIVRADFVHVFFRFILHAHALHRAVSQFSVITVIVVAVVVIADRPIDPVAAVAETAIDRRPPIAASHMAAAHDGDASAMGRRVKSTVSFAAVRPDDDYDDGGGSGCVGRGPADDGDDEEDSPLVDPARTRVFSVSKDRPITRIPTRVEMKTLTHKAKRPAVDIEFHDLTYAVNTTAGR